MIIGKDYMVMQSGLRQSEAVQKNRKPEQGKRTQDMPLRYRSSQTEKNDLLSSAPPKIIRNLYFMYYFEVAENSAV